MTHSSSDGGGGGSGGEGAITLKLKAGIHVGELVAGIVGDQRMFFRCFGKTMNWASRLCSTSSTSQVHVSEAVKAYLPDESSGIKARGAMAHQNINPFRYIVVPEEIVLKGIGPVRTFLVEFHKVSRGSAFASPKQLVRLLHVLCHALHCHSLTDETL